MNAIGTYSGCIRASDLTALQGITTTIPRADDASHISKEHVGGARNSEMHSFDGNVNLTLHELYEKITVSLSQSICYLLTQERHFLQVGSSTCLDAKTLSDSAFDVPEAVAANVNSNDVQCSMVQLRIALDISFHGSNCTTLYRPVCASRARGIC